MPGLEHLIRYALRKPWHDGSTHIEFEPLTLMRRLALALASLPRTFGAVPGDMLG